MKEEEEEVRVTSPCFRARYSRNSVFLYYSLPFFAYRFFSSLPFPRAFRPPPSHAHFPPNTLDFRPRLVVLHLELVQPRHRPRLGAVATGTHAPLEQH